MLRKVGSPRKARHARLNPLVLLLDAALTGELEVVQQAVKEVSAAKQQGRRGGGAGRGMAAAGLSSRIPTLPPSTQMNDPSQPNEEGITALHNAICGANYPIVDFLIAAGANVNSPDSHGW